MGMKCGYLYPGDDTYIGNWLGMFVLRTLLRRISSHVIVDRYHLILCYII